MGLLVPPTLSMKQGLEEGWGQDAHEAGQLGEEAECYFFGEKRERRAEGWHRGETGRVEGRSVHSRWGQGHLRS